MTFVLDHLKHAIRTSGRLRQEDHAVLARALGMIVDRPADFDPDPVKALVQAVAEIAVFEAAKQMNGRSDNMHRQIAFDISNDDGVT